MKVQPFKHYVQSYIKKMPKDIVDRWWGFRYKSNLKCNVQRSIL